MRIGKIKVLPAPQLLSKHLMRPLTIANPPPPKKTIHHVYELARDSASLAPHPE